MKTEYKESWLADLKAHKRKRATGRLCNNKGRMCCLGVLAEGLAERNPELLERLGYKWTGESLLRLSDGKVWARILPRDLAIEVGFEHRPGFRRLAEGPFVLDDEDAKFSPYGDPGENITLSIINDYYAKGKYHDDVIPFIEKYF